jgi:hypothetical protein
MKWRAGKGAPVKLVTYPGAYHAFDAPNLGTGRQLFGHWLKYDADAAQHSQLEVRHFLATELANRCGFGLAGLQRVVSYLLQTLWPATIS